jgi:hypothetical protein
VENNKSVPISHFKPQNEVEKLCIRRTPSHLYESRTPEKKKEKYKGPPPLENALLLQIQVDPFGHNVTLCILHLNNIIA